MRLSCYSCAVHAFMLLGKTPTAHHCAKAGLIIAGEQHMYDGCNTAQRNEMHCISK